VIVGNELRSESVAAAFTELFSGHFKIRRVFYKDLHETFRNPAIHVYICKRLREPLPGAYIPPPHAVHTGTPGEAGAGSAPQAIPESGEHGYLT